ncbi:MAG: hypothetical protein Q4D45_01510 [Lachnospiraceae bacterium]|nr:hypothetical protein [Lachnospiraceae bacterium]
MNTGKVRHNPKTPQKSGFPVMEKIKAVRISPKITTIANIARI